MGAWGTGATRKPLPGVVSSGPCFSAFSFCPLLCVPERPSAGTLSTRCWLRGRRRSPPRRDTESAREAGFFQPLPQWAGPRAALSHRPRPRLQRLASASLFFQVGDGWALALGGVQGLGHPRPCPLQQPPALLHPKEGGVGGQPRQDRLLLLVGLPTCTPPVWLGRCSLGGCCAGVRPGPRGGAWTRPDRGCWDRGGRAGGSGPSALGAARRRARQTPASLFSLRVHGVGL